MEQEPNIFPEMKIIEPFKALRGFIGRIAALGATTELCLSEHKRGAAEMLDQHLDQPELPFGQTTLQNTFDDMGNYYSPYIDRSRN